MPFLTLVFIYHTQILFVLQEHLHKQLFSFEIFTSICRESSISLIKL